MLPKVKEFTELVIESENPHPDNCMFSTWENWYGFGLFMQSDLKEKIDIVPATEYCAKQKEFVESISKAFFQVTEHYMDTYGIKKEDNWKPMGLSICRYDPKDAFVEDLAMYYHTDYVPAKKDEPGLKFTITCTTYLNDDYEGGEISFLVEDKDEVLDYKPKSGDIMVFPSGEPYYHGVKTISSGYKYFIRAFWCYDHPGSQEWLDNQIKYGKEEWQKIYNKQVKEEIESGKWHKYIVEPGKKAKVSDKSTPYYKGRKHE
jgi:hypothetical protein